MIPPLHYRYRPAFSGLVCALLWLGVSGLVQAQLQLQFPVSRMVFQRSGSNQSTFSVVGTGPAGINRVEVRLTPVQPGQGTTLDWQLLDASPVQGQFKGIVTVSGGWYQLNVRAIQQSSVVATGSIDRVGVGEVFLIAGQPNGRGLLGMGAVAAADDRISCINYENAQNDTTQLPHPVFSPVAAETFISPKGRSAWCWGRLGDLLTSRMNVPVLFYNVASAATTVRNWKESAEGKPTAYTFGEPLPAGMPYNQFRRVVKDYVSQTGVRAVLWHQGEAEPYDTTGGQRPPAFPTNYTQNLQSVINRSRQDAGASLAWMVARVSIDNTIAQLVQSNQYQPVIDAQNQTIQTTTNVFYGPETDVIQFPRTTVGSGVHFTDEGLIELANAWNASLTNAFFSASVPIAPSSTPFVDLEVAMQADKRVISVNHPLTFSVVVTNRSAHSAPQVGVTNALPPNLSFIASPFFTNNQGTLSATVPSVSAGQSVVLTYTAVPIAAGFYQNAVEISHCGTIDSDSHPGSDVADGEDDQSTVDFRTVEPGNSLFRTPIRSTTPPSPAVLSNQPTPSHGLADLSVQSIASNLVATVGQFWSLTLLITNQGVAAAQNVQVGCVLPANLSFSGSPNMSLSSGTVRGSVSTIPAGGSGALWFTAVPNLTGVAFVRSQVEAATPGDPDSVPNNGFTNGEDDTAQTLIRGR
ncbi:MAG: DUF11 domain-containing protein [Bacteroidetes bacterium]|nr:DUF11 domain-containing protein [Fibrella sp.]